MTIVLGIVITMIQKRIISTCVASNVKNPKEPVARNKTNNDKKVQSSLLSLPSPLFLLLAHL